MAKFQYIYNNGVSSKFIEFTVGTSYMVGAVPTFNVSGLDSEGNTYTATMIRGKRGEFLIYNLQQIAT